VCLDNLVNLIEQSSTFKFHKLYKHEIFIKSITYYSRSCAIYMLCILYNTTFVWFEISDNKRSCKYSRSLPKDYLLTYLLTYILTYFLTYSVEQRPS